MYRSKYSGDNMQSEKPKFIFNCQKCGLCCGKDVEVLFCDIEKWSRDGTIYQIFEDLVISGQPHSPVIGFERADGKCKMFNSESKECKIYHSRPIACQAYPLKYDGNGFFLRDSDCPGLNIGEMSHESLVGIRKAAMQEHEDKNRTAAVLPALQALLLKDMAKKSEEAFSKLSDDEKAKLEEILKKEN
jgi:Fe-S-cluster containining protein